MTRSVDHPLTAVRSDLRPVAATVLQGRIAKTTAATTDHAIADVEHLLGYRSMGERIKAIPKIRPHGAWSTPWGIRIHPNEMPGKLSGKRCSNDAIYQGSGLHCEGNFDGLIKKKGEPSKTEDAPYRPESCFPDTGRDPLVAPGKSTCLSRRCGVRILR